MNNSKLTVQDMKEMIELFIHHKLYALKIGDFEIQKNHYEPVVSADNNKTSFQDDLFYSAPQFPPEIQEYLSSMQGKK